MDRSSVTRIVPVSNPREVGLITVAHAVNEFYSVALPPILPLLVADLDISYAEAGGLLAVFYIVYSVFQLPAGVLSDRIGKAPLLAIGMVVLAAGMLVAGVAGDYLTLVLAEVIAGIGGSTYHPTGMSLISDLETGDTEGKAMGVHGFGGVAGTAAAPALIGGLATVYDWRLALGASAAVGAVYALVFVGLFDEERATALTTDGGPGRDDAAITGDDAPGRDDAAATDDDTPGWLDDPRAALAGALRVPLTPWLGALFIANFFVSAEIGATRTFTTSYLFDVGGGSTALANAVFFLMLVGGGISSLWAGHLADRVDRRALGLGGFAVGSGLLAVTGLIPIGGPFVFAWFLVLGMALYATLPAINALTSEYSDREWSGSLFGVMLTAGSLGGAAGPLAFGVVASEFGMAAAFPSIAAVGVLGGAALAALFWL